MKLALLAAAVAIALGGSAIAKLSVNGSNLNISGSNGSNLNMSGSNGTTSNGPAAINLNSLRLLHATIKH